MTYVTGCAQPRRDVGCEPGHREPGCRFPRCVESTAGATAPAAHLIGSKEPDLRGGEAAGGRGLGPRPIERCSSNCNSHFPARKMLSLASQSAFDHRSVSKVCAFFANVPVPDLFRLQAWIMAIWRSRSNENALAFAALTPFSGVRAAVPGFRADIEVVRHSTRCRLSRLSSELLTYDLRCGGLYFSTTTSG